MRVSQLNPVHEACHHSMHKVGAMQALSASGQAETRNATESAMDECNAFRVDHRAQLEKPLDSCLAFAHQSLLAACLATATMVTSRGD